MRVLFGIIPGYGHLHPLVPLARAFEDAGHDVLLATSSSFVPLIELMGLPVTEVDPDWLEHDVADFFPEMDGLSGREFGVVLGEVLGNRIAPAFIPDLTALLKDWHADVVLGEGLERYAAAAASVHYVNFKIGIPVPALPGLPPVPEGRGAGAAIERALEALGIAGDVRDAPEPLAFIDTCPPSLHYAHSARALVHNVIQLQPRMDYLPAIKSLTLDVESENPLVHVTFGTVARDDDLVTTVLDALTELPVRVLLSGGEAKTGGARVSSISYLPHDVVLPICSAIVSHAGWGTLIGGLWHRLPNLTIPILGDQFANAARLASTGASRLIWRWEVSPARIRNGLARLLQDPVYRLNAERLRAELEEMPAPKEAVEVLERLVESGKPYSSEPLLPDINL